MGSTGKLVVSYEADPPVVYSDNQIETRVRNILTPLGETFDEMSNADEGSSLVQIGNTFILQIAYMGEGTFTKLLESLISASTDAWLLIYCGLDDGASIMLEIQNKKIITQRERMPVDDLNDYSDEEEAYYRNAYSDKNNNEDVPF